MTTAMQTAMSKAQAPNKAAVKAMLAGNPALVEALIFALTGVKLPKAVNYSKGHVVSDKEDFRLKRDAAIVRGFKRKGLKDNEIKLRENVKPYKLWLAEGRQVRKGEKSVRGFFHISQTDLIPTQPA